jgi:hypothetical protein
MNRTLFFLLQLMVIITGVAIFTVAETETDKVSDMETEYEEI